MIRTLSILFLLSLTAVVWFRTRPDAQAEPRSDSVTEVPAAPDTRNAYRPLAVRSMGQGLSATGEWRGKPVMTDLNRDGKTDLVTSIRRFDKVRIADGIHVFLGDGKGQWTPCDEGLARDMGYGGTDAADINGDGRPDLVYSGHDLPPRAFLNFLGHEGQNEWVALDHIAELNGTSCSDVALGDFSGDGSPDLAIMGFFPKTGGLYVMQNDGHGEFGAKRELMPPTHYGAIVRFEDIDADGRVELIAATSEGPKVWKCTDGEWTDWSDGLPTTFGIGQISGIVRGIAAKDVDGDGLAELAVSCMPNGEHKPVRLFRRDKERWVAWGTGLPEGESCFDVVFARLPDGAAGLYLAGQHGALVVRCARDGACEVVGRIQDTAGVLNVGAGDVDGDGDDEMLVMMQRGLGLFAFDMPARETKEINDR